MCAVNAHSLQPVSKCAASQVLTVRCMNADREMELVVFQPPCGPWQLLLLWTPGFTCNYKPLGTDRAVNVRMFLYALKLQHKKLEAIKGFWIHTESILFVYEPHWADLRSSTWLIHDTRISWRVSPNTNNYVLVGRVIAAWIMFTCNFFLFWRWC